MRKIVLSIEGMTCSACSNGLEKYLQKQKSIQNATVNLVLSTASIEYSDDLEISDLERYIEEAGFKSLGIFQNLQEKKTSTNHKTLIFYGVLALTLMYITMNHMLNAPIPAFLDKTKYPKSYSLCLLILTLPFFKYGFDILKSGFQNLVHRMPNMDTLVTIGVASSFLYSVWNVILVFLGEVSKINDLYFESTAFVIYFIKLGRIIDKKSKQKTKEAIQKLVTITPQVAKLKIENDIIEVTIDEVQKGDILVSTSGERIAVDGKIIKGEAHFDESFITGESNAPLKKKGNRVIAGSINYDGNILYQAEKIGKDSIISEIVKLVVNATNTKPPIARLADKVCSYFVPLIIVFAILTLVIALFSGMSLSESIIRFVTVLVVACPCALGLATPLAIVISEGVCAKKGIFVKNSEILEVGTQIDTICFDKTGTLTNGGLRISQIYCYENWNEEEILKVIGSMEQHLNHPIAKGLMLYIKEKNIKLNEDFQVHTLAGYGIESKYKNHHYLVGNAKLLKKYGIKNIPQEDESKLSQEENSIIYLVEDTKIVGLIGMQDTIRKDALQLISSLQKMGIDICMLTGDNEIVAQKIAKALSIENAVGNLLPDEKNKKIFELKKQGRKVMMIGDGINDAPSLVLADIGVSISGGTEIAIDSSDVILMNDEILKIYEFLKISKKTLRNIKQNLFWAFLYNICMLPIAAGWFQDYGISINPMIACICMIISSLTVVGNALRLKKF